MVQRIDSLEKAKKVEKRLNDIIIEILSVTQKHGLSKEMYEIIYSLQDLRDEIYYEIS